MAVASSLGQATPPFYPPQKKFPGEVTGYQEPSGAKLTGTGQPTGTGSPPGLSSEAEASSGHDMTSGALTGSLSNRFHFHDKGAGGWKWPLRPLQEEPPAPDESPWTRPTRYNGPHLRNERTTEIWAYGRFYAKLGIYQYGRERWLRLNLTSGLSSCTQVFELAWTCVQHRELYNDSILFI